MNWKAGWNATTACRVNDAVQKRGASYMCITPNTGQDPITQPAYWTLFAAAGATGPAGPTGPQGPIGPQGPAGSGGTGTVQTWGETPSGNIDGSNMNYTTAYAYSPNLLAVFLNGLRQRRTADYTETGSNSFSFVSAPLAGDSLSIDYVQP